MVTAPLRLGVVSYLNAEPLVYGLAGDPAFALERDVPSRVAARLLSGELDLGMIPAAAYADDDYAIVPGIAIASRGAVRSVRLYHRGGDLAAVRRVALDTSSRTSVVLARVLLHEILGREVEAVAAAPDLRAMLDTADAAVLIGDPALYDESGAVFTDLGEEWTRRTGLPFVYAFWAGPAGATSPAQVARLREALADGLANLARIASGYDGHGAGRAALNEAYLRANIHYAFGPEEQAGVREFYRRAHDLRLIPRVPGLRFHADR
jgi:chorismate dehydratase